MKRRRHFARDGSEFVVVGALVQAPRFRYGVLRQGTTAYDLAGSPVAALALDFAFTNVANLASATILWRLHAAVLLTRCMREREHTVLTAEAFADFLAWIASFIGERRRTPPSEASQRTICNRISLMYQHGVTSGWDGYTRATAELIQQLVWGRFRGASKRERARKQDTAVSDEEYIGLLRAARLELIECRAVLKADAKSGQSARRGVVRTWGPTDARTPDPNPWVVFCVLAACQMGLRPEELNPATQADMREAAGYLAVNAPNKTPALLALTPQVTAAWLLCRDWNAAPDQDDSPLLSYWLDRGEQPGGLRHVDTSFLNDVLLPRFYRKYFNQHIVVDGVSRPVLADERSVQAGAPRPFKAHMRRLRAAFGIQLALVERNREFVRRIMRHKQLSTTEESYLQRRLEDRERDTVLALRSFTELIGMLLTGTVVPTPQGEERTRLEREGRLTKYGDCGHPEPETLNVSGDQTSDQTSDPAATPEGYPRCTDCLICPHRRLHADRKPLLLLERARHVAEADRLDAEGYTRDAENCRQRAALCQANADRIDEIMGVL